MNDAKFDASKSLRLSSCLLIVGQVLYIVVTRFHAGGEANNHSAIFTAYAGNAIWGTVHLGQFLSMAVLLGGMIGLFLTLEAGKKPARWTIRFGTATAAAALALYGALQAVDGVALKQAVNAWASAAETEKAARFATAEAIRWLEWGMRSYQDFALGLALLLLAAAVARTAWMPRPAGYLIGLTGLAYLAQGWVAGTEGFTSTQSLAIVLAWALSLVWMIWILIAASWRQGSRQPA